MSLTRVHPCRSRSQANLDVRRISWREFAMFRSRPLLPLIAALAFLQCAPPAITPEHTENLVGIISRECYALTYTDPVSNATARLFPIWVALFPGRDSGSVVGRPHPEFDPREWPAMNAYRWWKILPSDSIEVNFNGNYEAIHLHFQRSGTGVVGQAIFLSDIVDNGPLPSMRLVGRKESC